MNKFKTIFGIVLSIPILCLLALGLSITLVAVAVGFVVGIGLPEFIRD